MPLPVRKEWPFADAKRAGMVEQEVEKRFITEMRNAAWMGEWRAAYRIEANIPFPFNASSQLRPRLTTGQRQAAHAGVTGRDSGWAPEGASRAACCLRNARVS